MCGIVGYTGTCNTVPILIEGLRTLEYRGYDSAGICVSAENNTLKTVKAKGRLQLLEDKIKSMSDFSANCGIGHTRWATHGEPSDRNSHPHSTPRLSLVHNGIIENYMEIETMLTKNGYYFESETDTEAAAKLIDMLYCKHYDPIKAIFEATHFLRGSYAFGIIFSKEPGKIYAIRRDSPLVVAQTETGGFIASDVPAVLAHTNIYYRLDENVVACVSEKELNFFDENMNRVQQKSEKVDWNVEQAKKGGYPFFMLKEIYEEPDALRKTLEPRINEDSLPHFGISTLDSDFLKNIGAIHIVACGTAMHAGLIGKTIIEKLARVPVNVEIASEFRYRDPILRKDDLVILLSQSGETADTLAALRHAKAKGVYTLAIVNVIGSSVAREADDVLYTWAGPEIAVASTKAYSVQCSLLYLFALRLAMIKGKMADKDVSAICRDMLANIPSAIEKTLVFSDKIREIAKQYVNTEHLFYIGRGVDCDLCTEGSLKLKEISYIHSEAYAAGELKHGTISLITEGVPVIAVMSVSAVCEKTISGIREVKARGARVFAVITEDLDSKFDIPCDEKIVVPSISELLAPFPTVTVLQLLAYHVSALKGLDVDKPRNLAKSVTVE